MRRREFIAAIGGAAVWPLVARAQQPERMRRIGVLMSSAADEPDGQARLTGFLQGLQEFGWTAGRNVRIEYRWAPGEADRRKHAAELVALTPDVIMASTSVSVSALLQAGGTVPIVFASVTDPVGHTLSVRALSWWRAGHAGFRQRGVICLPYVLTLANIWSRSADTVRREPSRPAISTRAVAAPAAKAALADYGGRSVRCGRAGRAACCASPWAQGCGLTTRPSACIARRQRTGAASIRGPILT